MGAIKNSGVAQINAAKINGVWHKLEKDAESTSSLQKKTDLRDKIKSMKEGEKEELHKSESDRKIAEMAALRQHEVAKELDKSLEAAIAKVIAAEDSGMTEAQQT